MSTKMKRDQEKAEAAATRVSLPAKEASKASFPPGCRVLCFDETGFRVGMVKDVQISISLPTGGTFGTYYDVEINGSQKNGARGKGGAVSHVFTESSLRFTPGCPVEVTSDYFGSVFRFAGNGGKIQGTVIGCFEMPPSQHTRSMKNTESGEKRKYFYSVRVKFKGMDEAVEAHGVPPEHVRITTDSGGRALSEITGDYNAEVLDCFSPSQKDNRVRRPEDIPLAYTCSHDSGDYENNLAPVQYDSENDSLQSCTKSPASRPQLMTKGFAGRYPSAEPSIRRLRNLQVDGSISPTRRSATKVRSKNRSLTPGARSARSSRGNLQSSPSRARIYKVGPGVVRPPSCDANPTTKTDSYEGTRRGSQGRQKSDALEIESREDAIRGLDGYEQNEFGQQQDEVTNYLSDDLSDEEASMKGRIYDQKDEPEDRIENVSPKKLRAKPQSQSEQQEHRSYKEDARDEVPLPRTDTQDWDNCTYSQGSEGGFEDDGNFHHTYDSNHELDQQENHRDHIDQDGTSHGSIDDEEVIHTTPEQFPQSEQFGSGPTHEIEESLSADQYDNVSQPENQDTDSSYIGGGTQPENQDTDPSFAPKRNPRQVLPAEVRDKWAGSTSSKDGEQFPSFPKKTGTDMPILSKKSTSKRVGAISTKKFKPFSFLGNNATSNEEMAIEDNKLTPVPKDAAIENGTNLNTANHNAIKLNPTRQNIAKQSSGIGKIDKSVFESSPNRVAPSTSIPLKPPTEGCYLSYMTSNGGAMAIKYSHGPVNGSMGFWYPGPGHTIQGFKFKQNQGRSDIIKNVIGRDFKKKYFSGWCQFVKAAKKSDGVMVKWPNNGGLEVDLYVFNKETCEIKQLEDGVFCDVSVIDAVACIPAGNPIYSGVRKGEYNKFLNIGQGVGSSIAIGGT